MKLASMGDASLEGAKPAELWPPRGRQARQFNIAIAHVVVFEALAIVILPRFV